MTQLYDQGVYIGIVVDSVINNLISGGILAIIIIKIIRPNLIQINWFYYDYLWGENEDNHRKKLCINLCKD